MAKIDKHIEIVRSSEIRLSSMSQKSCDALFSLLSQHYTKVGVTTVNNLANLQSLVMARPDLVFLGMKYIPAEFVLGLKTSSKIWLAGYLDRHGIACTGSGQNAHRLEFNKALAKQCALDAGLMSSPFLVIKRNQSPEKRPMAINFPVFIKPLSRGGGTGIDGNSMAHTFKQLRAKVSSIASDFNSDALLEEYLPGREFSVAILKNEDSAGFSIMPIELIAPLNNQGDRILSRDLKSSNSELFMGVTDKIIKAKISALALNVFQALGARDYGRIDIRLDANGTPHFLEANLIPSLISGYGSFPKACVLNLNMGYEEMIMRIVDLGLARNLDYLAGVHIDGDKLGLNDFAAIPQSV